MKGFIALLVIASGLFCCGISAGALNPPTVTLAQVETLAASLTLGEPVALDDLSAPCLVRSGDRAELVIQNRCTLVIAPSEARVRVLSLTLTEGSTLQGTLRRSAALNVEFELLDAQPPQELDTLDVYEEGGTLELVCTPGCRLTVE